MNSRQFVKILCTQECINYEKAAKILVEKTGRHFTKGSLSDKLYKDTLRFTEAFIWTELVELD